MVKQTKIEQKKCLENFLNNKKRHFHLLLGTQNSYFYYIETINANGD